MENYGFQFEIGDTVTVKAAIAEAEYANRAYPEGSYGRIRPPRLVVVHRRLEQCYGGTQRHYDCRLVHALKTVGSDMVGYSMSEVVKGLHAFSEPELIAFTEPHDEAQDLTK